MLKTVLETTNLYDGPIKKVTDLSWMLGNADTSNPIGVAVEIGDEVELLEESKGSLLKQKASSKIKFIERGGAEHVGWVQSSRLGDHKPHLEPMDAENFTEMVMLAARNHDMSPSYLMAMAHLASGLENKITNNAKGEPHRFGPFQYTQREWDRGRKSDEQIGKAVTHRDINDPAAQCVMAALTAKQSFATLKQGLGRDPSWGELILAETLLDADCAVKLVKAGNDAAFIETIQTIYQGEDDKIKRADASEGAVRFAAFMANSAMPGTVKAALDAVATALDRVASVGNDLLDAYYEYYPDEKPADPPELKADKPVGDAGGGQKDLGAKNNILTEELLKRHAHRNAREDYIEVLTSKAGWDILTQYRINANKTRLAGFLANCFHETGGLKILRESLVYTTARRLRAIWPSRFGNKSDAELAPLLRNEKALAGAVYIRPKSLGNRTVEEAYHFRGAGYMQTTGRFAFIKYGKKANIDFNQTPLPSTDDALTLLMFAAAEWAERCNQLCDAGNFDGACGVINTGSPKRKAHGLQERRKYYRRFLAEFDKPLALANPDTETASHKADAEA